MCLLEERNKPTNSGKNHLSLSCKIEKRLSIFVCLSHFKTVIKIFILSSDRYLNVQAIEKRNSYEYKPTNAGDVTRIMHYCIIVWN